MSATALANISPVEQTATHATAIRAALKSSLYPGASDASIDMLLDYCEAAKIDPMSKSVHIVFDGTRDAVMPGIGLYRIQAHRTNNYAGQDDVEFGPTVDGSIGGVTVRYPEWCKFTVYRVTGGQRFPYSARIYWMETYAAASNDTDAPHAMWVKRPFGQFEKCAEALALRKAFPEAVGSQPTAEEMIGRSVSIEPAAPARAAIEMPKPKSVPVTPAANDQPAPTAITGSAPAWNIGDSQKRLTLVKAKAAGLDEAGLLERFGSITMDNINSVLSQLSSLAAEAQG